MVEKKKTRSQSSRKVSESDQELSAKSNARCLPIAAKGIKSSGDVKSLMAAIIPDILEGTVNVQTAGAVCNAAGKLIKMVELELKYGGGDYPNTKPKERKVTGLQLVSGD